MHLKSGPAASGISSSSSSEDSSGSAALRAAAGGLSRTCLGATPAASEAYYTKPE